MSSHRNNVCTSASTAPPSADGVWRDELQWDKENAAYDSRPKTIPGGLRQARSQVIKLMKGASEEKAAFAGRRKPLGQVSTNGSKLLQSKAASKAELQKIQSKLTEVC
ncbi:hypothetical protein ACHAXT_004405 [Thalassiosira profunda]